MAVRPGLDRFDRGHKNCTLWHSRTHQLSHTSPNLTPDVAFLTLLEIVASQQVHRASSILTRSCLKPLRKH
jgi:hypothetical protein